MKVAAAAAVVSALATSYGAYSQDQSANKGRQMQRTAQQQAQNSALKQEQQAEQSLMKANQKKPDIAQLLTTVQDQKPKGTLLSGTPSGTNLLGL